MKITKPYVLDYFITVVFSAVISLSVIYYSDAMLHREFHTNLQNSISQAFEAIENISTDTIDTLEELNKYNVVECNDETLLLMRKRIFLSEYIKDIGYFENNKLVCTSGLGMLSPPLPDSIPDYVGEKGVGVWLAKDILLFNRDLKAIAVRKGRFNALIRRDFLGNLLPSALDWELLFTIDGDLTYVAGKSDIYVQLQNQKFTDTSLNIARCSDRIPYCLGVKTPESYFEQQYRSAITGWYIIAGLIFICCFTFTHQFIRQYRSLHSRVRRGLHRGAFYCLYQPIVELDSGRIVGCEVLARFSDGKGDIYPDAFIPIISAVKQTWPFTRSILNYAFNDIKQAKSLPDSFKLSFNAFPQDIESGAILGLLQIDEYKTKTIQVVIEVTEDQKLCSVSSNDVLKALNSHGYQIAIDDFGTGYSNLRQIRDVKCHILKIDRSFVSEMEDGSIRSSLIPHILDIAQKLNVSVVAEGIENTMQSSALKDLGVKYGQGYMFGKPMPFDRLLELIAQTNI